MEREQMFKHAAGQLRTSRHSMRASSMQNGPNMVAGGSVCLHGEHFRPHGLLDWGADDPAGRTGRIGAHQHRMFKSPSGNTVPIDDITR